MVPFIFVASLFAQIKFQQFIGPFVLAHNCAKYVRGGNFSGLCHFFFAASALTFVYTVLPVCLAPLYPAFMESSAGGATLGKLIAEVSVKTYRASQLRSYELFAASYWRFFRVSLAWGFCSH